MQALIMFDVPFSHYLVCSSVVGVKSSAKDQHGETLKRDCQHKSAVSARWADSASCLLQSNRWASSCYNIAWQLGHNTCYPLFSLWNNRASFENRSEISSLLPGFTTAPETLHCERICDCITVLIPILTYLSHNGSIETEAVCDHHVDLPLAVLLSDALVGGEPWQGGLQCGQAVAGGQADVEQLTRLLRTEHRVTVMRDRKQKLLCANNSWIMVQIYHVTETRFEPWESQIYPLMCVMLGCVARGDWECLSAMFDGAGAPMGSLTWLLLSSRIWVCSRLEDPTRVCLLL